MRALILAALVSLVPGCGPSEPDPGPWEPVAPEFMADPRFGVFVPGRIDAVLGSPLVVILELAGGFPAEEVGAVKLDDGREIPTRIVWVGVRPGEAGSTWLPPSGEWAARTAEEVAAGSVPAGETGSWAIVVDPPIDAVGQGIWIAGQRHAVNWLPDASVIASRVSPRAWASPLPPMMRGSGRLRFLVETERASPMRRWRYKLMAGELMPSLERRVVDLDGRVRRDGPGGVEWSAGEMASEVLETLAVQQESKWAIALARLDQADDELAEGVRQRLCAVVDFGAGEVAPLWPVDEEGLDRLLSDLLDQQLAPRERARRARLWLDDQPASAAWVVSDAPRADGVTGEPRAIVAAANLSYNSRLASVSPAGAADSAELSPLAPLTARASEVSVPRRAGEAAVLSARVGEDSHRLPVPFAQLPASPPGLRIESFAGDWTMASLLAGEALAPMGGGAFRTGALLYREPGGRWMLYVECASQRPESPSERVRVTLGAEGSSDEALVLLSPSGAVSAEAVQGGGKADFEPEAEVSTFPGGWSARLVIPERVIEARGSALRLGIERIDALGRRSAWPRALLPWQGTCGRAAIDLSAWGGLGVR